MCPRNNILFSSSVCSKNIGTCQGRWSSFTQFVSLTRTRLKVSFKPNWMRWESLLVLVNTLCSVYFPTVILLNQKTGIVLLCVPVCVFNQLGVKALTVEDLLQAQKEISAHNRQLKEQTKQLERDMSLLRDHSLLLVRLHCCIMFCTTPITVI